MSKIAIDIVLLPDRKMIERSVELSRRQAEKYNDKILLNGESCLPHISLAMGIVDKDDLEKVNQVLNGAASGLTYFKLTVDAYQQEVIPGGGTVSFFSISKTEQLKNLHAAVMDGLKPYLQPYLPSDTAADILFSPPAIEETTLYWIKNYYSSHARPENFKPHITIGFGMLDNVETSIDFTAPALAICHLGNYCTCRKILFSKTL